MPPFADILPYLIPLHIVLFATLFWFVVWVMKNPHIIAKGQDAAGRGMMTGMVGCVIFFAALIVAISAAAIDINNWSRLHWVNRVLGLLPLGFIVLGAAVVKIQSVIQRERRAARDYAEAMAIPAALIVDVVDARESQMYNAIKPRFPTLEITMRQPGALFWQQAEWFPRVKLFMMNADAMAVTEGDDGKFARDLLAAFCKIKPTCPIVLHASYAAAAEAVGGALKTAGWRVEVVMIDGDDWVTTRWVDVASGMLAQQLGTSASS